MLLFLVQGQRWELAGMLYRLTRVIGTVHVSNAWLLVTHLSLPFTFAQLCHAQPAPALYAISLSVCWNFEVLSGNDMIINRVAWVGRLWHAEDQDICVVSVLSSNGGLPL